MAEASYRFHLDDNVSRNVQRIASVQLEQAGGDMQIPDVHNTRKRFKKLRALFRLTRGEFPLYHAEKQWLRNSARDLAERRAAEALLEVFNESAAALWPAFPAHLLERVRRELELNVRRQQKNGGAFEAQRERIEGGIRHRLRRVSRFKIKKERVGAVAANFETLVSRAKKALKAARRHPMPESYHELRKRSKTLWYAARLMQEAAPKPMKRLRRRLKKVGDCLGQARDLYLLEEFLRHQPPLESATRHALLRALELGQQQRFEEGARRAEEIFQNNPKKLARRVRKRWTSQRAQWRK